VRSGKTQPVALDEVVEILDGLARHDAKRRPRPDPVGMVRRPVSLRELESFRERSHAVA